MAIPTHQSNSTSAWTPVADDALVSVIIPCYKHAHFLSGAIESVLAQTYQCFEIIVVDDGSPDNTSEIAARYAGVRCIRKENQGLPAARNTGLRESKGDCLVFLDADDHLLPNAFEANLNCLKEHPECAFVYGQNKLMAEDGSPIAHEFGLCIGDNYYLELLRRNHIAVPASVMYRRALFDIVGGFNTDTSVKACEDYDLYLRVAREFPIRCHDQSVVIYRQHGSSMSQNFELMLKSNLNVLQAQRKHVKGNKEYERAIEDGIKAGQDNFGERLVNKVRAQVQAGDEWKQIIRNMLVVLRYYPRGFTENARRKLLVAASNNDEN